MSSRSNKHARSNKRAREETPLQVSEEAPLEDITEALVPKVPVPKAPVPAPPGVDVVDERPISAAHVGCVTVILREDKGEFGLKTLARFTLVLPVTESVGHLVRLLSADLVAKVNTKTGTRFPKASFSSIYDVKTSRTVAFIARAAQLALQFPHGVFVVRVPVFGTDPFMDVHSSDVESPMRKLDGEYATRDMRELATQYQARKQAMFDATQKLRLEMAGFLFPDVRVVVRAMKELGSGFVGTPEDMKTMGVVCSHPRIMLVEIR